jgi:peroxiredoxin
MAVPSQMVPLGTPAPDFALPDLSGTTVKLGDLADAPALLVMFACNHCPYVKHVESAVGRLLGGYETLATVAICSNDWNSYPDDAPPKLAEQAARAGWDFPYLLDESQDVARAYQAACTPDFFLYDADRLLAYRGSLDESTPGNGKPVTGERLRAAIDLVLSGRPVPEPQIPSMGCSIKFR